MDDDPILRRRATALRLATTGQRVGYFLLVAAIVVFVVGLVIGLTDIATTIVAICMGVAAVVLGPSIILGYAAKAAEREERTGKSGH